MQDSFGAAAFACVRRTAKCSRADLTDALGPGGAGLEAVVALAAVAPHRVDAAAVLADARLGAALVQVCRGEREEVGTRTWKRRIRGFPHRVTHLCNPLRRACAAFQEGRYT